MTIRDLFDDDVPQWAKTLRKRVARYTKTDEPIIEWKSRNGFYSSGCCYPYGRIIMREGNDHQDAKLVFLHELAHGVVGARQGHSIEFWKTAMRLYKHYGIPPKMALEREYDYMKKSVKAFKSVYRSSTHLADVLEPPVTYLISGENSYGVYLGTETVGEVYKTFSAHKVYDRRIRAYVTSQRVWWHIRNDEPNDGSWDEGFKTRKAAVARLIYELKEQQNATT